MPDYSAEIASICARLKALEASVVGAQEAKGRIERLEGDVSEDRQFVERNIESMKPVAEQVAKLAQMVEAIQRAGADLQRRGAELEGTFKTLLRNHRHDSTRDGKVLIDFE